MIKYILLSAFLINIYFSSVSQTFSATVKIGDFTVSEVTMDDEIIIPVKLVEKSGGLIKGLQFYIEYDHSVLEWKGSDSTPMKGIRNLNEQMPFDPEDWLFNHNGTQLIAVWMDPKFTGVEMGANELFFEIILKYKGGLKTGSNIPFIWGTEIEMEKGLIIRGETKIVSDKMDYFDLKLINGSFKLR